MFKRLSPALVVAQVVAVLLMFASPVLAATETSHQNSNQVINGNLSVSGTTTNTGAVTNSGNVTVGGTLGVTGASTLSSTLSVTGAVTLTTPLTAANIQSGSAKRQIFVADLAPNTGAAIDATVYRATIFPGRAGSVKRISLGCQTAPTAGTDTIKVLKGSSSGNTMLNAASFDAKTLTSNQVTTATLTGTSTDLDVAASGANSCIYCEYSAGVQVTGAVGVTATIEFEPTDF